MLLNQLVRINEAGIVADSVNFGLMEDQETNQRLCEGFVFNYDKDKLQESTVGILEALRSSYDSRSHANVHLLVQQYGKGKSHFAVAIANYFSKPTDSPEVEGILHQVENATGRNHAIVERLRLYKKRGRHLVLCLSGDRAGDIKKQFLQSLLKVLEQENITNSVAQHLCSEPLSYLQGLNAIQREQAEEYLASIGNPDGDLNAIIKQLQKSNPAVIPNLKNLAKHLIGFVPDWNVNLDIEEVLKDLIVNHCSGEDASFQGILILFDELNFYLQNWAKDPIGSGGTALQNITNICEAYKSKIALLSFTQIDPLKGVGIPAGSLDDHKRLASRLAPRGSTYINVASSLELVLDNLLIQEKDSPTWRSFASTWDNTLLAETNNAFEKRITTYKGKGWTRDKFHEIITIGCFPLHPLTSYLLCNLEFTVDRTALQFIKTKTKAFIQNQPLTSDQEETKLNFIYPTALIETDTFLENFASDSNYSKYLEGASALAGSDDPNELIVLKALFLFHASGSRLAKTDREPHEDVLATLTGLSPQVVKTTLEKLTNTRDLIYYKPGLKLYRFWAGVAPTGIEEEIEEEIRQQKFDSSVNDVVTFCNLNIERFLGGKTLAAKHFADTNKLVLDDWHFEHKVYTIDGFIRALSSDQTLRGTQQRGIIAYVVAETQAELQDFRRKVDSLLLSSPIRTRIAVAVPSDETGDLAHVLLKIRTLKNKGAAERRSLDAAFEELLKRWEEQVKTQAGKLLKSCTYHCTGIEKLPPAERDKPQRVISVLLDDLYRFVPPVESIDKLRSNHMTGRKVVGSICRRLLAGNLTSPLGDNAYSFVDPVFVQSWRLLRKNSGRYSAQEPSQERIRAAWDVISTMTSLGDQPEKTTDIQKIWRTLSDPPYGYSEYNFTMLLVGWLAYHQKEVTLRGNAAITGGSTTTVIRSLKDWADTNILEKPDDFVKKWIVTGRAQIIRRKRILPPAPPESPTNYSNAEAYLLAAQTYLESGELDPAESSAVLKTKEQLETGVNRIREWFQPIEQIEAIVNEATLAQLLEVYPNLNSPPPALILRDDVISVQPTNQQRDRQAHTLQVVTERIEQLIDIRSEQSESLQTEEECGKYKTEVQAVLAQMNQVSSLPPHLTDTLRYCLQAVDRRILELREAAKVRECLSRIENRYRALSNAPTQEDYLIARRDIEALSQSAPAVAQEEKYEQLLQDLDHNLNKLAQKVEIWEEKSSGLESSDQIHELMGEINGQRYRFTEAASVSRISRLLNYLKQELSAGQSKDEAIRSLKATLSNANRKLEKIRDVAPSKLQDAFQSYQELMEISLPTVNSLIDLTDYQQELEGFKAKGRASLVSEGFAKIYNLELRRLEDYARLKTWLQQRLEFIAVQEDFADVKASLEQALQSLEARHNELQEQQQQQQRKLQDEQIIKFIRTKYRSPKTNTVQFLEDGIREIQSCQARLYEAEPVAAEIEQIVQSLQDKITNHRKTLESLRDRLLQVQTLNDLSQINTEYVRLEFVFKDSSAYPDYLALQPPLQQLEDDLGTLQILDSCCQQSRSIAACREALAAIQAQREKLQFAERFQAKLAEMEGILQHKIQTYVEELEDFEHRATRITNAQEARKLHEELLKQSAQYTASDAIDRYEAISTTIRLLIDLLRIAEAGTIKTLAAYETRSEELKGWKANAGILPELLQERFDAIYEATEKVKAQILNRQQADAERWLRALENQLVEIDGLTDAPEKSKRVNKLSQKIEREQPQHIDNLSPGDWEILKSIEGRCEAAIAQDRENQIKLLFQQLPRSQRISLYHQLKEYLSDPTEEFDG